MCTNIKALSRQVAVLEEELAALRSLRGQGGGVTVWGGGVVEEKLFHQESCASNGTGSAEHRRY
jgi:hypothetical protein